MTLVGRTTAIKTLTDAFTDCAEGCSRTVLVEGPTGCGKSALVHLLIERAAAAGAVVRYATGSPAGRRIAWGVLRQLPAGRPGPGLRQNAADRAPGIEHLRALCAELREVSEGSLLVLCVDDVHHGDDESLAFLPYLARRARPARTLLVVAGTIPHESGDPEFPAELMRGPAFRRVRLERLGRDEVSALAERAGCREQAAFRYESSGGNPAVRAVVLGAVSPTDLVALHRRAARLPHRQQRPAVEADGHPLSAALSATVWSATGEERALPCDAAESRPAEDDVRRGSAAIRLAQVTRRIGPVAAERLPAGPLGAPHEDRLGTKNARPPARLLLLQGRLTAAERLLRSAGPGRRR